MLFLTVVQLSLFDPWSEVNRLFINLTPFLVEERNLRTANSTNLLSQPHSIIKKDLFLLNRAIVSKAVRGELEPFREPVYFGAKFELACKLNVFMFYGYLGIQIEVKCRHKCVYFFSYIGVKTKTVIDLEVHLVSASTCKD